MLFSDRKKISQRSLLLLLFGALDDGSAGNVESLETSKSNLSGLLRDVGQAFDNFSDSVDASLEDNSGGEGAAVGALLHLADLVVALVLLEEGNNSLGALLLSLSLRCREAN